MEQSQPKVTGEMIMSALAQLAKNLDALTQTVAQIEERSFSQEQPLVWWRDSSGRECVTVRSRVPETSSASACVSPNSQA